MRKTVVLLCLSILLASLVPGVSWSQGAFDIKIYPSKVELSGEPGSVQQFVINVENMGATEQMMRVYFNDYYIRSDNQFVFKEPGHYSYSCATWLSTDASRIVVPARKVVQKAFTVTVPKDAEHGGHYGIIFFEQIPSGGQTVQTVPRIGVVTLVTVPGEIVRKGTIEAVKVSGAWFWPTKKLPLLPVKRIRCRVVFRNEGNVHLTIKGKVTYTPTFGWGTGAVKINEATILPKTTRYLEADLPNPPFIGSYEATAEIRYGPSLDVFDTVKTKKGSFQIYPLSIPLILLLLIVIVVVLMRVFRRKTYKGTHRHKGAHRKKKQGPFSRRKPKEPEEEAPAYEEETPAYEGETLTPEDMLEEPAAPAEQLRPEGPEEPPTV